jgi:MarR family transcriptional regulator, temperature-dependent positive regulator of motility
MNDVSHDEIPLQLMRLLEANPQMSQRALAEELGLSLGKTHYCIHALIEKGWIKARNFKNSDNKLAYAYALTPSGIRQRANATVQFLKRKRAEYAALKREIAQLEAEVASAKARR